MMRPVQSCRISPIHFGITQKTKAMKNLKKKLRVLKARIAYQYAKFKATQRSRITRQRQFVVMTDDGRLLVMDKSVFYKLRKRKCMPAYIKPHMLAKISVWHSGGMYKGRPAAAMSKRQADSKRRRYLLYVRNLK